MFELGFYLNWDPSHLTWIGIDPLATIEPYLDQIVHTQAKDVETFAGKRNRFGFFGTVDEGGNPWEMGWWQYRVPGLGEVDWRSIIDRFHELGYAGTVSVEHEDPVWSGTPEKVKEGLQIAHRTLPTALSITAAASSLRMNSRMAALLMSSARADGCRAIQLFADSRRGSGGMESAEPTAVEDQRRRFGQPSVADGMQAQQHDGVVAGEHLAIDRGVELGQSVVEGDCPFGRCGEGQSVEAPVDGARQLAGYGGVVVRQDRDSEMHRAAQVGPGLRLVRDGERH
jgi:hypothetical protein